MTSIRKPTRREFLQTAGGAAVAASALHLPESAYAAATPDLAVVTGKEPKTDPKALVKKAVEALGGMKQFVSKGDVVVVKPNIGWDRMPRQAANTNPDVVAAVCELVQEAGAKKVLVFDNPVSNAQGAYERSGIMEAAKAAGAEVKYQDKRFYKKMKLGGKFLKEWPVYTEAIECDCLINVPIAKHHSMAGLTMSLKNHMGIIGGERSQWHRGLDYALAEFAAVVRPKLTILDAYRILLRNGPTGGSVRDTEILQKCVAGVDQVAVDAYATRFFQKEPDQLGYLVKAKELGVGETDVSKLNVQELTV